MKKYLIILGAAIAFAACNKIENTAIPEETPSLTQQEMTFNFKVGSQDETKSKLNWESGDVVYVLFKNIASKYVKLSYDGANWAVLASEAFAASDFPASAGDKVLTAVHFPQFVGDVTVAYESNEFTFKVGGENIYTYYMSTSTAPTYTVSGTTVTATITMSNPNKFVQFFLPMTAGTHTYQLLENNITPKAFASVALDGTVTIDSKPAGYALNGYATSNNGTAGVMFSGYLATAGTETNYTFSLVTNFSAAKPYALGTQKLSGNNKNISSGVILNLPGIASWSAMDPFVDMGAHNLLWATGNLGTSGIEDPEAYGLFYDWAGTVGYAVGTHNFKEKIHWSGTEYTKYTGSDYTTVQPVDDAAYQASSGAWRLPTGHEAQTMIESTTIENVDGIVDGGLYVNDAALRTSTTTGIKLLLMNVGIGSGTFSKHNANWWTSSYNTDNHEKVFSIYHKPGSYGAITQLMDWNRSTHGFPVRPVKPVTP